MSSRLSGPSGILEGVYGAPTYLGTITADATTPKTAATTAVPFTTIVPGQRLLLQADAAFYFLPTPSVTAEGLSSTAVTVTAATGLKVAANDERQFCLRTVQNNISVLSVSGTVNVKVFRLD